MLDVVSLPVWLLGMALGAGSLLVVAGVFALGARLFPSAPIDDTSADRTESGASGDAKRRREIRDYLETIGESFVENHPIESRSVAFYLPERDVAITFDPRAYYRLRRSSTHAVLVEHELPGVHLGSRLPFETPALDIDDGEIDPASAAFAVLDVPTEASAREVTAAYREKVKRVHPDHGGDHEEFKRVREAYTTAKERAG
ncbi:J domain-containing protein [Halococcus qingdaonensis]|uniref:J domain-containing protein n=1 Tax=Halococcus qingdaonensis TaxID=224402 RepID=UPI00211717BE|nr:J domain-containing protein [Halococcus qingdaonensis]